MNWYEIITTILVLVLGFASWYVKTRTTLMETAQSAINTAEEQYQEAHSGATKFNFVVEALYNVIPAPMRMFFTKEVIGELTQTIFNQMERFAITNLDKAAEKAGIAKKDIEPVE